MLGEAAHVQFIDDRLGGMDAGRLVVVPTATLIVRTPRFVEGDDVCCPAKVVRREYVWSAGPETLRLRNSDEEAGPS